MNPDLIAALSGCVTLILGVTFFYFPWQTHVVDQTRQRLFEVRDRWFDYTHSQLPDRDKEAAERVRNEINYLIRLTHTVTFPVLLCAWVGHTLFGRAKAFEHPLDSLIRGFQSEEAAKRAKRAVSDAFTIVTWGMIRRSIPAMLLTPFVVILFLIFHSTHWGVSGRANKLDPLIQSLGSKKGDLALSS